MNAEYKNQLCLYVSLCAGIHLAIFLLLRLLRNSVIPILIIMLLNFFKSVNVCFFSLAVARAKSSKKEELPEKHDPPNIVHGKGVQDMNKYSIHGMIFQVKYDTKKVPIAY